MTRIKYVDAFRGIAILTMLTAQIFGFLSAKNIYDSFLTPITLFPYGWLFTFVVGMSVFLLVESASGSGKSISKIVSKYGKYVLFSLPFTWFVFGLPTFLGWEEAIQGIGLSAIITAAILFLKPKNKHLVLIILATGLLQTILHSATFADFLPRYPLALNLQALGGILANALWRGFFGITQVLPVMLAGTLFFKLIRSGKMLKKSIALSLVCLLASAVLVFFGVKFGLYARSFSYLLFVIGEFGLLVSLIKLFWNRTEKFWKPLQIFGRMSFPLYVGHFLLVLKPLQVLGLENSFSDLISAIVTIAIIISAFFASKYYLDFKENRTSQTALPAP